MNYREDIIRGKERLIEKKKQFIDFKSEYLKQYTNKKKELNNLFSLGNNLKENDIIECNIGGQKEITTKRKTFLKYPNSVLAQCFNGRIKLPKKNGKFFIDRDENSFLLLLEYLRNSKYPIFSNLIEENNFFQELNFWKIPLIHKKVKFQFNPKNLTGLFKLDQSKQILNKNSFNNCIVPITPNLNINTPYFEFKVKISVPCKNNSQLIIGLINNDKYSKSKNYTNFFQVKYCWDIYDRKLLKTDENGIQIISKNKYGFDCYEFEMKFAMEYNQENKTLSFYQNDINLGVAFHNVPINLTPVFRICFENGIIEILKSSSPKNKIYL